MRTKAQNASRWSAGIAAFCAVMAVVFGATGPVQADVSPPVAVSGDVSIFGSGSPQTSAAPDAQAVELGLRFVPRVAGAATGVRFFRASMDSAPILSGHLWTADGTALGTVTFPKEQPTGWQEARFAEPVALTAGRMYVVSYYAPGGNYAVTQGAFTSPTALAWADLPAGAGVFKYGSTSVFPTSTYRSSNYFADVLFRPTRTMFGSQRPAVARAPDSNPVELGVRFAPKVDGVATGVRFYRGGDNSGAIVTGHLWTGGGTLIGSVSFSGGPSTGWQEASFATPIPLAAGQTYVASYSAPSGGYSVTQQAFTSPISLPWADLPVDAGVYSYGSASQFPRSTFKSSNYFADITFLAGAKATAPAPAPGPGIYVSGSRFVNGAGETVVLHGVNRSGSEYACIDGWGFFDGPTDQSSIDAMKKWHINAVRVPLNSACWLDVSAQFGRYNAAFAGENYRRAIKDYVDLLNRNGMYAILDLHWTGCGTNTCLANWLKPMPDRPHATRFWSSVGSVFKDNRSVLFDLFNEPQGTDWPCWKSGGCTAFAGSQANEFTMAGMQEMVDAVRAAGAATQPLLLGGLQYSNDMRGWAANLPRDPSSALAASIHLYNFNYPCPTTLGGAETASAAIECLTDVDRNPIGQIAAEHPIVFGELGQDDCRTDFVLPMLDWMKDHGYSALGWAWNTFDCSGFPSLISDYSGTPTGMGLGFKEFYSANYGATGPIR